MKKYIVLYHMPAEAMEAAKTMEPKEGEDPMAGWMEWAKKCGDALVDLGTPLGNGMKVSGNDASAAGGSVAGYSILQAESMDAALELLQDHPHNAWHAACSIEVHEEMPMPGSEA